METCPGGCSQFCCDFGSIQKNLVVTGRRLFIAVGKMRGIILARKIIIPPLIANHGHQKNVSHTFATCSTEMGMNTNQAQKTASRSATFVMIVLEAGFIAVI